jgi:hypothetical protein
MSTLRDRVTECERRHPAVSRADIARAAGVKAPSVTDWFNGKTLRLKLKTATGAARLWRCDPIWLGEGIGAPNWLDSATPTASALQATPPTLEQALPVVLSALRALPEAQRTAMTAKWAALLLAPDSAELARWLGQALGEQPWNGVNRRHGAERRQDDAPPPVQETPGRFAA